MCKRAPKSPTSSGFTLLELLAALAIVAIVAGILFAVFGRVGEHGRQAACASNLQQFGMAIAIYSQDNDERRPVSAATLPAGGAPFPLIAGWAGRVYPYVKSAAVFACPDDSAPPARGEFPVSYGLNSSLGYASLDSQLTAPASAVLLFEALGDRAKITQPDEGQSDPATLQTSAAGLMDNAGDASLLPFDKYAASNGRHSEGANFLAPDEHAKWLPSARISAGAGAPESGRIR